MKVATKNWLLKQPLLLPAASLASVILIIDPSGGHPLLDWVIFSVLIALSAFCSRKIFFLTCVVSLLGAITHYNTLTIQKDSRNLVSSLNREPITIYGIIDSAPRNLPSGSLESVVKVIHSPDSNTLNSEKILSYISTNKEIRVGEKLWLKGTLTLPNIAKNPQVFDKQSYLHRQNISVILQTDNIILTGETANSHKIASFAEVSRQWIREKLTSGIENTDAADIILAMFLGEKPTSDGQIITDFKNSGTIHVFAVSGLHVMMIGAIFTILLKLCRAPPSLWIPSVIIIMLFYAIVTGMRPPAMRASIMGTVVLLAILLLRKPSLPSCLWLSAIIALLWNTHSLFLPGFQLSYTVLIAIAFTGKWWMDRYEWVNKIDPFMPESLLNKRQKISLFIRKKSSASLAVSTSAWTGSSLLIWLYFGIITPLAIIASLPLMLLVFLLLGTCCLSLVVGSISPTLGNQINQINALSATAAHKTSHLFASIPYTRHQSRKWSNDEKVIVYQLDSGGGIYLSLGGGILLDAGNQSAFNSQILPGLKKNGAKLDTLIASHSDIKHIQGLTQALTKFPIKQILIPASKGTSRSPAYIELVTTAEKSETRIITATERTFPVAPGITMEIIHIPDEELPLADDRCLIFMLHWHHKRILFINDSGHYFGHWLRKRQSDPTRKKLNPDALVVGKHSRNESLHPDLIGLLKPKVVIATQALYPADQSRTNRWISEVKKQCSELYLLNQTGAITITQDEHILDYETFLKNVDK